MNLVFVYITSPDKKTAEKISLHLLKKKLIACANFFPSESFYWWKGKVKKEKEVILITKTTGGNFEKIKREVEEIHPYSVPCIVKIPVSSNKKFFFWLKQTTV